MGPVSHTEGGAGETEPSAGTANAELQVSHQVAPGIGDPDGIASLTGEGRESPPPGPDCTFTPLRFRGVMGERFAVTLLYPGGERPTHSYTVFRGMPVSFLRYNLACLLRCEAPISLFVGPHWLALAHSGTITDRVFPGTSLSCTYVEQGSEIRVQTAAVTLLDTLVLVSAPLFDPNASSMTGVADPPSLSGDVVPEEWGAISSVPILWGRADPPPHPDAGREWSDTNHRADRARWDSAKGSVSPPPSVQARDLFSDEGDGLSLRHLRRKGENAGRYFSSGSGDKEESLDEMEGTQAPRDKVRHEDRLA